MQTCVVCQSDGTCIVHFKGDSSIFMDICQMLWEGIHLIHSKNIICYFECECDKLANLWNISQGFIVDVPKEILTRKKFAARVVVHNLVWCNRKHQKSE